MRKRIARWYYIHIICKETEQTFYEGPRPVGAVRKMREIEESVQQLGLIKTIIRLHKI